MTIAHINTISNHHHPYQLGVSLVLAMSESLNKSSLDSISYLLFDQTILCSVYVLYHGCISPLSFSEIHRKITSNHLLQLEIGENCSMQPFYHVGVTSAYYIYPKIVILMILYLNFWWFCTRTLTFLMIPNTNFGEWSHLFSIRFNCDFISLKQTISIWAWWKRWHPYCKMNNSQEFFNWITMKTYLKLVDEIFWQ